MPSTFSAWSPAPWCWSPSWSGNASCPGAQPGGRWSTSRCFRSRGFTWGTILATVVSFAMFGLLFTVPTYYEAIVGVTPLGAGVRLLPMIGGLVVGRMLADRLASPVGAKITVALGFALIAGGLCSWAR